MGVKRAASPADGQGTAVTTHKRQPIQGQDATSGATADHNSIWELLDSFMRECLKEMGFDTLELAARITLDPSRVAERTNIYAIERILRDEAAEDSTFLPNLGAPRSLANSGARFHFRPGHIAQLENFLAAIEEAGLSSRSSTLMRTSSSSTLAKSGMPVSAGAADPVGAPSPGAVANNNHTPHAVPAAPQSQHWQPGTPVDHSQQAQSTHGGNGPEAVPVGPTATYGVPPASSGHTAVAGIAHYHHYPSHHGTSSGGSTAATPMVGGHAYTAGTDADRRRWRVVPVRSNTAGGPGLQRVHYANAPLDNADMRNRVTELVATQVQLHIAQNFDEHWVLGTDYRLDLFANPNAPDRLCAAIDCKCGAKCSLGWQTNSKPAMGNFHRHTKACRAIDEQKRKAYFAKKNKFSTTGKSPGHTNLTTIASSRDRPATTASGVD
eukprot:Clim_evm14s34 gene=Clim_evmTU14s34